MMSERTGTVYRVFDANGELLYVGMSSDLATRLKAHVRRTAWWPLVCRVESDAPLPLAEAFRSECDQIVTRRPRFNRNAGVAQWHGQPEINVAAWRAAYEAGLTVEQIALEAGTNTGYVRNGLLEAGTVMRRPGAQKGKEPGHRANPPSPPRDPVMRVAFAGARRAHRRRGGKAFV